MVACAKGNTEEHVKFLLFMNTRGLPGRCIVGGNH